MASHGFLADVHGRQPPSDRHRARAPDGVEFIALLVSARAAAVTCVGVFAYTAYRQAACRR